MKVGFLTTFASRQAGGLFWSMTELASYLQKSGCDIHLFSGRDTDVGNDKLQWGDVSLNIFDKAGPVAFGYMPQLTGKLKTAPLDILHTHGLWTYPSVAAMSWGRYTGKPRLISPHGMLDSWAVRNSYWKKRLAGLLYEDKHLHGANCLHALCEAESLALRAYGLKNPIAIIPNGVTTPDLGKVAGPPAWMDKELTQGKTLLFLGRLHPKKGLYNLIKAWGRMVPSEKKDWFLVIAGWDQQGYELVLKKLVLEMNISESVRFVGPQFGEDKVRTLACADAFVLPSFSEGLPVAVLEAWSYSLPVVMTYECNIPEGFTTEAAISIDPTVESIAQGLRDLTQLSDQKLQAMGLRGLKLVESKFNWPHIAN